MARYVYYPSRFSEETPFSLEYFPSGKIIPTDEIDMHSFIHLGIVLSGSYDGWNDGCQRHYVTGSVWLTGPLEPHTALRQSDDCEAIVATFQLEDLGRGFPNWDLPFLAPFSHGVKERHDILSQVPPAVLLELGKKLRDLAQTADQDACTCFEQWLVIHQIFTVILRPFLQSGTAGKEAKLERIRPALMLPRERMGVPVSLEEAAKACKLSASRFGEIFRIYTGKTFCQYELRFRLSNAKDLVATSDRTFKEIAQTWGFYDTSHFVRIFRQCYGITPGEYRKSKKSDDYHTARADKQVKG